MTSEDVHMEDLVDSTTSSDSDDSDLDELLNDDDMEMMLVLFGMKQMEDRAKLLDQRKGSTMRRVCIPRNRALGHEQLMQDYFAEVPTYPPRLFRRRCRMHRSLFERIVRNWRQIVITSSKGGTLPMSWDLAHFRKYQPP
jgi:hypothetical protein